MVNIIGVLNDVGCFVADKLPEPGEEGGEGDKLSISR